MAGPVAKKRSATGQFGKAANHPSKKRKQQQKKYNSDDSDEASGDDFDAVNLLDSDDDLDNAQADDDFANDASDSSEDDLDSLDDDGKQKKKRKQPVKTKSTLSAKPTPANDDSDADSGAELDDDNDDEISSEDEEEGGAKHQMSSKSKRNDPTTFSTSLNKILGTKLSTTRRVDPVLSRSAEAREASRRVVDAALEEKARRQMRLEKRAALEKGRVKDVLIASNAPRPFAASTNGDAEEIPEETTASIMATEKRLRKSAQRGVVQLFNAVRMAQVKAAQAKQAAQKQGLLGIDKRETKATEMSKKGFLELIASGGGGLKKGPLEEA